MSGPVTRDTGRALIVDPAGRALMIRGQDPDDLPRGGFWFTPGGGLDPGESIEQGTKRELYEELGLVVDILGPVVMTRRDRFLLAGVLYEQSEVIHLVEVTEAFEPRPLGLTTLELRVIKEFRWFSAEEIRRLDEDSYPLALASLLDQLAEAGPPDPPWIEDLISED
jgi:8-oxo-dGTP pyrophosphatase MutT (NUDIX family)